MMKLKILNNPSRFHLDFLPGDINYPVKVFFLNKNGTISWQTQVENHGIQRLNNFGFQIIKGSAYNTCAFKMA